MWWQAAADLLIVIVFVLLGRDTHDSGSQFADVLETVAPFAMGVAVAWLVPTVRREPLAARTGAMVAAVTVVLGMLLRRQVFSGGTAAAFVLVAILFLTAGMTGWRILIARWFAKRLGITRGASDGSAEL